LARGRRRQAQRIARYRPDGELDRGPGHIARQRQSPGQRVARQLPARPYRVVPAQHPGAQADGGKRVKPEDPGAGAVFVCHHGALGKQREALRGRAVPRQQALPARRRGGRGTGRPARREALALGRRQQAQLRAARPRILLGQPRQPRPGPLRVQRGLAIAGKQAGDAEIGEALDAMGVGAPHPRRLDGVILRRKQRFAAAERVARRWPGAALAGRQ